MLIWIATVLGLVGGALLAYVLGKIALPRMVTRSQDMSLMVRLAFAGTVVAFLPAFFLSFVVGGTLGGAWGERIFSQFGLLSSGVSFGLALGIALVFAVVLLGGAVVGVLLAKVVLRYRLGGTDGPQAPVLHRPLSTARRSPQRSTHCSIFTEATKAKPNSGRTNYV